MKEVKLNVELYIDEDDFGLLVISDNSEQRFGKLPTDSFSLEGVTPESIGKSIEQYFEKYYK